MVDVRVHEIADIGHHRNLGNPSPHAAPRVRMENPAASKSSPGATGMDPVPRRRAPSPAVALRLRPVRTAASGFPADRAAVTASTSMWSGMLVRDQHGVGAGECDVRLREVPRIEHQHFAVLLQPVQECVNLVSIIPASLGSRPNRCPRARCNLYLATTPYRDHQRSEFHPCPTAPQPTAAGRQPAPAPAGGQGAARHQAAARGQRRPGRTGRLRQHPGAATASCRNAGHVGVPGHVPTGSCSPSPTTGLVDVLRNGEGEAVYRRCAVTGHHHHLLCRSCGKAVEVEAPAVEAWAARTATEHGFTAVEHTVEIFGLRRSARPGVPPRPWTRGQEQERRRRRRRR